MGIFDVFKRTDINQELERYRAEPGAVLLDVRTREEYQEEGHIPGSKNLDVQNIRKAREIVADLATPLFVYCYSGARSGQAVFMLKTMGYTDVTNIGGIMDYHGEIER